MKARFALPFLFTLFGAGCTYVKTDAAAQNIVLANESRVQNCQRLGTASAGVKADIIGINRKEQKVASELLALARNEAANMGGDTLVASSGIEGGKQRFTVYKCN
ncbi:DUF4156 domain-containing protein [Alteromonadaceae bacterium M269]|nr:DUF4156 domain-containing protein [Alteromonadaceae bacterium M269]